MLQRAYGGFEALMLPRVSNIPEAQREQTMLWNQASVLGCEVQHGDEQKEMLMLLVWMDLHN